MTHQIDARCIGNLERCFGIAAKYGHNYSAGLFIVVHVQECDVITNLKQITMIVALVVVLFVIVIFVIVFVFVLVVCGDRPAWHGNGDCKGSTKGD